MTELLDFYQQQAKQKQSSIPWVATLQQEGLAALDHYGFPTRHTEDWKYTSVNALLEKRLAFQGQKSSPVELTPPVAGALQIVVNNGQIQGLDRLKSRLPAGVIIESLADAMVHHAEKIKPWLSKIMPQEHAFQALNSACLQDGLFIYLPADTRIEEPLFLRHWQDVADQAVNFRHLIVAEANSQAIIVEEYRGADCCYFTNTVTEIALAARANLQHYKIQTESTKAFHIGHLALRQAEKSDFQSHSLSLGGKLVRSDIGIRLEEHHAKCLMNGIYAPCDGQHVDHHTLVEHRVPDCQSDQDYKGIMKGNSRAVFNGRVVVAKNAQHSQAKQQNKNLLLSAQAEIDTKPQLEIFADDVVCTHGATVGQLDEESLFYLATRGIDREEASGYLLQAFAADNLRLIPHRQMAEWIAQLLTVHLGVIKDD